MKLFGKLFGKSFGIFAFLLMITSSAHADKIFRIEVGEDYENYSQSDLKKRVWELEKAVAQLQNRVFQLEGSKPTVADNWVCTVNAMGEDFTGTGGSKAVATQAAMKACKEGGKDAFFCKNPKCEQ